VVEGGYPVPTHTAATFVRLCKAVSRSDAGRTLGAGQALEQFFSDQVTNSLFTLLLLLFSFCCCFLCFVLCGFFPHSYTFFNLPSMQLFNFSGLCT